MARARRRTVRIIKPRSGPSSTTISLLTALCAAIVLFLFWRFWREEEVPPVRPADVADRQLDWMCIGGHEFIESGQVGARDCTSCGRPAYALDVYECAQHGPYNVFVELGVRPGGHVGPTALQVIGKKTWVPVGEPLPCPRCKQEITRAKHDPFTRRPRGRNKPSG